MRDIFITFLFAIAIPYCLVHAEFGIALWYFTSLFQPQTQVYGFAQSIPFGTIVGYVAIIGWLFSKGPKLPPRTPIVVLLILLGAWTGITTLNAVFFNVAYEQWNLFVRLLAMVLLSFAIVQSRQRLDILIWAICIALGYYGLKTGLFGLRGGLGTNFQGPTFMDGNNELARGIMMLVPLLVFLFKYHKSIWIKASLATVAISSMIALVLSGSRGAWLATIAMLAFAGMRAKRRFTWLLALGVIACTALPLLPTEIVDRFVSIQDYKTDGSIQGRLDSWQYALDKFPERPLMGGGFLVFDYEHNRASHNSYFQALGEHGAVGLFLFVGLLVVTAMATVSVSRRTYEVPNLKWANDLAFALQVILVGYAVGSLSINEAFFPVFYAIIGVVGSLQTVVARELATNPLPSSQQSPKSFSWRAT